MGKRLIDQYSVLHWASGVFAYYWNIPFRTWMLTHVAFEIAENSEPGMRFINDSLRSWWPGGKPRQDDFINIIGDNVSAAFGWYCGKQLSNSQKERHPVTK